MLELVAHVVKRLRCDSLHVEHVFGWHEAGGARADIRLSCAAGSLREHAYRLRKQATGERKVGQYSYQGASATTLANNFGELGISTAVVFSTGYGDGLYPVYVQMNEDGRVTKVVIDFEGDVE